MDTWSNFFLGELNAAAALAGLLFVSVSVNHARILELGRMADRALESLDMLLLVIVVSSLALVPGQAQLWFGAEAFAAAVLTLAAIVPLQRAYVHHLDPKFRLRTIQMTWFNRLAVTIIALAGLVLVISGEAAGLYIMPIGILLSFVGAGSNAWVLLIEISR
jgi:hypothetical protein